MHESVATALQVLAAREATALQKYEDKDEICRQWVVEELDYVPISEFRVKDVIAAQTVRGDLVGHESCWLLLPAPRDGNHRIPVLNVLWDDEHDPPQVSFQVGVFYHHQKGEVDLRARAWRYETPEGLRSDHGFFHAQPSYGLRYRTGDGKSDKGVRAGVPTIHDPPDGAPTFPLDARDDVGLLVCVLVSIYGLNQARDLVETIDDGGLTDRFWSMHCNRADG